MHSSTTHTARFGWVLVALALTLGLLVATPPSMAVAAPEHAEPAAAAAAWVAAEYARDDNQFEPFGAGALTDIVLGLAVTNTEYDTATQALSDFLVLADDYTHNDDGVVPGAAGKAILTAAVHGEQIDGLEAELRAWFEDEFTLDAFNLSYAALGLATTAGGVPAVALDALEDAQEPDGSFAPWGDADPDVTALAAQALLAGERTDAATAALGWLVDNQRPDGAFETLGDWGTVNVNSTALAAQALRAGGFDDEADAAADWIVSLQFGPEAGVDAGGIRWVEDDTEPNGFATSQGLLAFDALRLDLLRAEEPEEPEVPEPPSFDDVPADHLFHTEIVWLAEERITRGCNPPENTNFCPEDNVTRGEMAAFLNRALGLPSASPSGFVDIADSVFVDDIHELAAARITRGCNPPENTNFCPDDDVTRGEMAAFLNRALDLPAADSFGFVDTADSVFVIDIDELAAARITRGCNPPANDRFCPDDAVTRGEMAAFLYRALG